MKPDRRPGPGRPLPEPTALDHTDWDGFRRRQARLMGVVALAVVAPFTYPAGTVVEVAENKTIVDIHDLDEPAAVEDESPDTDTEADPPQFDGEPVWRFAVPRSDEEFSFYRAGDMNIVWREDGVTGYGADGEKVWSHDTTEAEVSVSDQVVMLARDDPNDDRWPSHEIITVLDAATGDELWEETGPSFTTLYQDTIYLSNCEGGQDGELGECRLSAHEPVSGSLRWTTDTYASARLNLSGRPDRGSTAQPDPPFVVVEAYRTGADTRNISAVDARTGAYSGAGFESRAAILTATDTLIAVEGDDNPADGCTMELTAWNVHSGAESWKRTFGGDKDSAGRSCFELNAQPGAGDLAALTGESGEPQIIDLTTGEVEWTAEEAAFALTTDGDTLIAYRESDGPELIVYDVEADEVRWSVPIQSEPGKLSIVGELILQRGYDGGPVGYHVDTGEAVSFPGGFDALSDDWFSTCTDDGVCTGYPLK